MKKNSSTTTMRDGKVLLVIISLFTNITACPPSAVYGDHGYFLTDLDEDVQINKLALIGTHDSASYNTLIGAARTQHLSILDQLKAGIRVLDIRVRRTNNVFAMHHDLIFLNMMFGHVLTHIYYFFTLYPYEFVIMSIQEEYISEDSNMTECEILENRYIKRYPNLFVQNWSVEDNIKQHRGKILLLRGNHSFKKCIGKQLCATQNFWKISQSFTMSDKWKAISTHQDKLFRPDVNYIRYPCYINYLSAHGGVIGPDTIANGYLWYEVNLLDPGQVTGMNYRMLKYFKNPKNALYIIFTDYPTPQLISKIVKSNYE